jgi:hypothetical protein
MTREQVMEAVADAVEAVGGIEELRALLERRVDEGLMEAAGLWLVEHRPEVALELAQELRAALARRRHGHRRRKS